MTFDEKLLRLRRSRGWTQEELADKIDVTRQALSKWESGAALPDTKNVVALANLFGVTTDYLLCADEGAAFAENTGRGVERTRNKALIVGFILFILGLIGLLAMGIAGMFHNDVIRDEHAYRNLAGILASSDFMKLMFAVFIVLTIVGAVLLIRQIPKKMIPKSLKISVQDMRDTQAAIRAMREKEAVYSDDAPELKNEKSDEA